MNTLAIQLEKVTPELLQKTAAEYLRPENRTVLVVEPKAASRRARGGSEAVKIFLRTTQTNR